MSEGAQFVRSPGVLRWGAGAVVALGVLATAGTVAFGVWQGASGATIEPTLSASPPAVTAAAVYVHVSGAVVTPGLYRVDAGARVVDAIAAAGGFADDAASSSVNLARPLNDGEQIVVLTVSEESAAPVGPGSTAGGLVDLNRADQATLETLPRIGPALAARIIAYRDENGPFRSVDDLLSVPGIGEKLLAAFRDLVHI